MGRKSREKRLRREVRESIVPGMFKNQIQVNEMQIRRDAAEEKFAQHVTAIRAFLQRYHAFDAALAIGVSDLWPTNAASPIKHVLAWAILAGVKPPSEDALRITTYEEFKVFSQGLIAAYPDFAMLEDIVPEMDWGEVRVALHGEFVPMFYGSCIERTPDFVEAFRITRASNEQAQADMDLAVAIQSHILRCMPTVAGCPVGDVTPGHIEVPSAEFWISCREALLSAQTELKTIRANASGRLEALIGVYDAPLGRATFGNAFMEGTALPFYAMVFNDQWIPISVRNAPGIAIDAWANHDRQKPIDYATHWSLARFVQERFRHVAGGPMQIWVEEREFSLQFSCVIPGAHPWLIVCCSRATMPAVERQVQEILSEMRPGRKWGFKRTNGQHALIADHDGQSPLADDVSVLLVATLEGTGLGIATLPKQPIRFLPLADLISVFDAIEDLDELERFWAYIDAQGQSLSPISMAPVDLFASFRDTNEVLVDGAITPTLIALDPSWGSNWRYTNLAKFWANAPQYFPDGSAGWLLDKNVSGVIEMRSRCDSSLAYSVDVAGCTVQILMSIDRSFSLLENRMLNMFVQTLSDCLQKCRDLVSGSPLFQRRHVVVRCELDWSQRLDESEAPDPAALSTPIATSLSQVSNCPLTVRLQVNSTAVQAGLIEATTAKFEIASLVETIVAIHRTFSWDLSSDVLTEIQKTASRPARYRLDVVQEPVDTLEYVDPIVPTPTDYKLARRQLARSMHKLGFDPGRYELMEAKVRIDAGRDHLRQHIDGLIERYNPNELVRCCIEQHDALLTRKRHRVMRARRSLSHEVDYDRHEAIAEAGREFGTTAGHYRYMIEKTLSAPNRTGRQSVDEGELRKLVGLIDWYMVLAGASDILHNGVDIGGVEIDESYIPQVFYSPEMDSRKTVFERQSARSTLGVGVTAADAVEDDLSEDLDRPALRQAFVEDAGFELKHLLQSLVVLSQPVRHGLATEPELSYAASVQEIHEALLRDLEDVSAKGCEEIIQFLTLSAVDIRRLSGRDVDEIDVPFWERTKRLHRYAIRPLVPDGQQLRWGAEHANRALNIWTNAVVDGYLPAEFPWPQVGREIRLIKERIEKQLEVRTEEIFRRFTPFVMRGVDFFKKFKGEGFADVGDFDVLAYWPDANILAGVECKYNQPAFSIKDSRRLRDRIFGKDESDKAGQFSRIARRRAFAKDHRACMLELLKWPPAATSEGRYIEMYISRDVHWWMVHPPYPVPTDFVRVDLLDHWLKGQDWS